MCTVTFIPAGEKVFITSNRDEQVLRSALQPAAYEFNSGSIIFPKDSQAGGTWIAMHGNGHAMVLLNGAFEKHHHEPPYRKSRGLVFLEIFDSEKPVQQFAEVDLLGIEPFTLVLWVGDALWEMRWDGTQKFSTPKSAKVPQIWSSATLYDQIAIEKREHWFFDWLQQQADFTMESIRAFHEFGGEGNQAIDLMMSRYGGVLKTISITSMELSPEGCTMRYQDKLTGITSSGGWTLENDKARML